MILQSLVQHYEMLADKGKVTKPGWCSAKVSYAIGLGLMELCWELLICVRKKQEGKKQ